MARALQLRPIEVLDGAWDARQASQPAGGLVDRTGDVGVGFEEVALDGVDIVLGLQALWIESWQGDEKQEEAGPQLRHSLENGEDAVLEAVMALAHRGPFAASISRVGGPTV
ncbi:MAG TPA: hypothetical protein VGO52_04830 [Hyphomonadaceae bacterium]|nr:hypothetical protein [Hyphomonadaceae bacterium]